MSDGVAIGATEYTNHPAEILSATIIATYACVRFDIKEKPPAPAYFQPPQSASDRTPLIRAARYAILRHLPIVSVATSIR